MTKFLKGTQVFFIVLALAACSDGLTDAQYAEKAQGYLEKGEFRAASIEAKNALKQNPDNAQARWSLGRAQLELGDPASAEKELVRARALNVASELTVPLLARALVLQGKRDDLSKLPEEDLSAGGRAVVLAAKSLALLSQQDIEGATRLIDEALSSDPQSYYALVAQARLLVSKNELAQARTGLDKVFKIDPDYAPAWSLLGEIEQQEQHLTKADEAFTQAIERGVSNQGDRLKRALVRIQLKKFEEAQQDIDILKQSAPQHGGINYVQGLIFMLQDNLQEAQTAFEQAVNSSGQVMQAFYTLSLTHFKRGNYAQAEQYGKEFLKLVPDSDPGRKLMAMIRLGNQQYDLAEELIRPVLAANGNDVSALNLLANALLKQGKSDEAIEVLEKAASLEPESAAAQVRLGVSLLAEGEQERGIKRIETALELEPQFQQADILLVLNYLRRKEFEKALEAAEDYRSRNPDIAAPHNLLGQVFVATNKEAKARQAFEEARKIAPGDPSACQHLAAMALKKKDFAAARSYYQEVLDKHQDYLPVLLKMAALDALEKNEASMLGYLERAIEAHPQAVQPRLVMARYHLNKGEPGKAGALFMALNEAQKNNPEVLFLIARSHLARQQYAEALESLEKLLSAQPNIAHVHYLLAQAYAGLGEPKQTKAELKKAVELQSNHFPSHLALARMLLEEKQKEEFERHLKVLKELAPEHPDVLKIEASYARAQGDQQRALSIAEEVFKKFPNTPNMLLLAHQKWDMGGRKEALQLQEEWVLNHQGDVPARLALASAYTQVAKLDQAADQYRSVLEKDANNLVALNNLAWHLRDTQPRKALNYITRAIDIQPESVDLMDTLAMVLIENSEVEKARRTMQKVLAQAPENPTFRYHGAMVDAAGGDKAMAIKTLSALRDGGMDFPEKAEANRLLEQLKTEAGS